jgi:DNA-binding GntR family transcriptional regulator
LPILSLPRCSAVEKGGLICTWWGHDQPQPNSDERIVGYVEVFVDAMYSGVREALPTLRTTIAEEVERRYGVSIDHIEQEITVDALSKKQAEVLGIKAKTPALKIQRWYYASNGRPFVVATSCYPMGYFKFRSADD